MVLMAIIVATALFVPVGALIALVAKLFGVSLASLVTFGGKIGTVPGLVAWWAIFLVPALVYSAYAMPWHPRDY
jgi:hypothetical protein